MDNIDENPTVQFLVAIELGIIKRYLKGDITLFDFLHLPCMQTLLSTCCVIVFFDFTTILLHMLQYLLCNIFKVMHKLSCLPQPIKQLNDRSYRNC
ncbi:hypothetical protein BDZ94DRAFT_166923 [Collybia nuda]|uniref:Uncharacterized protein n=1 Tax=Collybia nuda TaxID=64659 RepID=A0A9P5YD26_9AGAR|nr:hypothetical protein BDZ94DRAFT_166923 [Collybia nuda]